MSDKGTRAVYYATVVTPVETPVTAVYQSKPWWYNDDPAEKANA